MRAASKPLPRAAVGGSGRSGRRQGGGRSRSARAGGPGAGGLHAPAVDTLKRARPASRQEPVDFRRRQIVAFAHLNCLQLSSERLKNIKRLRATVGKIQDKRAHSVQWRATALARSPSVTCRRALSVALGHPLVYTPFALSG